MSYHIICTYNQHNGGAVLRRNKHGYFDYTDYNLKSRKDTYMPEK